MNDVSPPLTDRLDADSWAAQLAAAGHRVVRTLGFVGVGPLLRACGLTPVAVLATPAEVGDGLPPTSLDASGHALLAAVVQAPPQPLLVATHGAGGAMLLAVLRELMRSGDITPRPLHGLDLLPADSAARQRYRQARLDALVDWAVALGGVRPDAAALQAAHAEEAQRQAALTRLRAWQATDPARLPASQLMMLRRAAQVLPVAQHLQLLQPWLAAASPLATQAVADTASQRLFFVGAHVLDDTCLAVFQSLERAGNTIVGDDAWYAFELPEDGPDFADLPARAERDAAAAARLSVTLLLHHVPAGDDAGAWYAPQLRAACAQAGVAYRLHRGAAGEDPALVDWRALLQGAAHDPVEAAAHASHTAPDTTSRPAEAARAAPARSGERSRKSLQSMAEFSAYQRQWFSNLQQRAARGEPLAVVNADAPQELLRSFDMPFVVNQWWASLVAAKQQSAPYGALLRQHGYPDDAEPYSAQGLAAALDTQPDQAPWGGLPQARLLMAFTSSPATRGLYSAWSQRIGAQALLFDRTVETRVELPPDWWQLLPSQWDQALESCRLDLVEQQFQAAAEQIARLSGRSFDLQRLQAVMDLVNEQEGHYRRTRDLIAAAPRAPVCIADTMPATMVPQWHRGTVWGRDAARALYDEVRARVDAGEAVCPDERLRLMWVGRGLWSDMGFYQRWQASHGAVFVWSMYLALAADGYIRHVAPGQSPMRALASRFVTMGDELRMPTWAGAWHVHEARQHRVDAAVAVDDADPQVLRALERAGIPVLRLHIDNFQVGAAAIDAQAARLEAFLDSLLARRSAPPQPAFNEEST